MSPVSTEHSFKPYRQADKRHRCDEHGAAHGGSPLFGHMPVGPDFQDLLPGLLFSQPGNVILTENRRHQKCQDQC